MSTINTTTDNSLNVSSPGSANIDKGITEHDSIVELRPIVDVSDNNKPNETNLNESHLTEQTQAAITTKQLDVVAQKLQDFVGEMNKGLEFSVDKESGRDVIKVIDKNSGDLIKQYPSEEVLDLVAKLSAATGNFVNTDV
jgi:flagellar protein FlaG